MELPIIEIKNIKKKYIIGNIGTGTLGNDVKSWWARIRKKEDPNAPILEETRRVGNEFMALNGVTFNINKGERIGIIGGNGAGKSTLLKILSRVTAPTSGEIVLRGRVTSMLEVGTGFNPEMTGRENIYLNGAILGMTKAEIDAKLEQIIDFSEVREFIDTPVKRYSSGMYVKLAFSVSAHLDSEILIMDEVLAVGDAGFQKKCLDKMQDTAAENNRTILFVSHSMANIKTLCDRCVVLKDGKVIFDGDTEKAISIYSGVKFNENLLCESNYDIQTFAAPNPEIAFKSIKLLNGKDGFINNQSSIDIAVNMYCFECVHNAKFRIVLKAYSGEAIGMGIFEIKDTIKGEDVVYNFSVATKGLISGKFYVDAYIGRFENGTIICMDTKSKPLIFQLDNTEDMVNIAAWSVEHWGRFRLEMGEINETC